MIETNNVKVGGSSLNVQMAFVVADPNDHIDTIRSDKVEAKIAEDILVTVVS